MGISSRNIPQFGNWAIGSVGLWSRSIRFGRDDRPAPSKGLTRKHAVAGVLARSLLGDLRNGRVSGVASWMIRMLGLLPSRDHTEASAERSQAGATSRVSPVATFLSIRR